MRFRSQLAKSLPLVKNNDDELEYCVERVASEITSECLALKKKRDVYNINIDKELAGESVGNTSALLLYDEVRLFRYSAAVHVAQNYEGVGLLSGGNDTHSICDNFDGEISTPNCKLRVHCLAVIMAEVQLPSSSCPLDVAPKRKTIKGSQ